MATKASGGESCYEKAYPDEPIFTLRAQDQTAPDAVRAWARLAHGAGAPAHKVEEALRVAAQMETWQAQNHAKVPD